MELWQFINTPQTIVFGVALMLMLFLFILEIVSVFLGGINDWIDGLLPDSLTDMHHAEIGVSDIDGGTFIKFLSWLYVGRLPLLMVMVIFLTVFGLLGYGVQATVHGVSGFYLPSLIAVPVVWFLSLPIMRVAAKGIYHIMPKDESTAIDSAELVGRVGVVVIGTATHDKAAQVKVKDTHGQTHYVMAYADGGEELPQGQAVLLVSQDNMYFRAIANHNSALVD